MAFVIDYICFLSNGTRNRTHAFSLGMSVNHQHLNLHIRGNIVSVFNDIA